MEDSLKGQPRASSKSVFLSLRPRAFHACLYSVRLPVASPRQKLCPCFRVGSVLTLIGSLVKIIALFHSFPGVIDVDRFSHAIVRRDRGSAHADPGTGQYVHLAVLLCSDVWMRSRSQELWYVLVARHDPIWCWRAPLNHTFASLFLAAEVLPAGFAVLCSSRIRRRRSLASFALSQMAWSTSATTASTVLKCHQNIWKRSKHGGTLPQLRARAELASLKDNVSVQVAWVHSGQPFS